MSMHMLTKPRAQIPAGIARSFNCTCAAFSTSATELAPRLLPPVKAYHSAGLRPQLLDLRIALIFDLTRPDCPEAAWDTHDALPQPPLPRPLSRPRSRRRAG